MKKLSTILALAPDGKLVYECPGCDSTHEIPIGVDSRPRWDWNGDITKPTFTPSINSTYTYGEENKLHVCHTFVTDGNIQYLSDCTHSLAGKTVPIPPLNTVINK